MKKIILIILLISVFLSSCYEKNMSSQKNNESKEEVSSNKVVSYESEISKAKVKNVSFNDNDFYAEIANNVKYSEIGKYYNYAFSNEGKTYLTFIEYLGEEKNQVISAYSVDKNGKKNKVALDAWNCLYRDETLYYLKWDGEIDSSIDIVREKDGKRHLMAKNIDSMAYGKEYIYYRDGAVLYRINYVGENKKMVFDGLSVTDGYDYFEYNGEIWLCIYTDGHNEIFKIDSKGNKIEITLPKNAEIATFRNGYLYFTICDNEYAKVESVGRYNIVSGEIENLPCVFKNNIKISKMNFTDNYLYFIGDDNKSLYKIDSSFENPEDVYYSENELVWLVTINNRIFLQTFNKEGYETVIEIDKNGVVLHEYN